MRIFLTISAALALVLSVSGCGDQANASAPAAQPKSAHRYVMKDGLEYGYEVGISEDARRAGQAAASLAMYRYLGRKGDTYQVMLRDGEMRMVFECSKPCDYGKIHTFAGTQYLRKDVMKLAPEAIVASVVADAMSGQLEQNVGTQNNKAVTYWVDGEGKRLVVADATTSGVVR